MKEILHGVVLRCVRFGESQQVVDVFTREHGMLSIVTVLSHGRRGRSGASATLWRVMNFVEFSVDMRPTAKLPRPADARAYIIYFTLLSDPVKTTQAMFLAEFLSAVLRQEQGGAELFDYVERAMLWLDRSEGNCANFHLIFLLRLMTFVGVRPRLEGGDGGLCYFDLRAGQYVERRPLHPDFLTPADAARLPLLFRLSFSSMHVLRLTREQRRSVLEQACRYYRIHLPGMPELKSLEVLREVFG